MDAQTVILLLLWGLGILIVGTIKVLFWVFVMNLIMRGVANSVREINGGDNE